MRTLFTHLAVLVCFLATGFAAQAVSLQVTPVTLDVSAPRAAETIRLRNLGARTLNAQVRIYRWVQKNGKDRLVETRDVVASPPFARIAPNGDYVLRVIRVTKRPVLGEESYRLLVDQLPDRSRNNGKAVNFVLRHSIPVFFSNTDRRRAGRIKWTVVRKNGILQVMATNRGNRRIRVSALNLTSRKGGSVSFGKGLIGYALGKSTAIWSAKGFLKGARIGSQIRITAQGENGPLHGTALLQAGK